MNDLIRKIIPNAVQKVFGKDRIITMRITSEDRDRDDEVITFKGWYYDQYMKNPVVLWSHDYHNPAIGKTLDIKPRPRLKAYDADVQFAKPETYDFAGVIYQLLCDGVLGADSVGFMHRGEGSFVEGDIEKGEPSVTWLEKDLLEHSICNVGSNPAALAQRMVKYQDQLRRDWKPRPLIIVPADITDPYERIEQAVALLKQDQASDEDKVVALSKWDQDLDEGEVEEAVIKPETTENYHRVPVPGEEGKHSDHRIRTIDISKKKGIKALNCTDCKKNITYLFDADKWTMAEAKKWVEEHKISGGFEMGSIYNSVNDLNDRLSALEDRLTEQETNVSTQPGDKVQETGPEPGESKEEFARRIRDKLMSIVDTSTRAKILNEALQATAKELRGHRPE